MNMDRDTSSTDEYFVTAVQIFDYCGADNGGTLRVDALMEKFAPFDKNNKAEYSFLKSLLDPDHSNPEISVSCLASALAKFTDCQKSRVDLDESFNLKTGPMPPDSDSGISTDGSHLVEDLQCELREKSHLAAQLRSQLDYTDRQHEEAIATLTAERDSIRAHLNMLREENMTLTHVRRDYEEACERLCQSERSLGSARRELEAARRSERQLHDELRALRNEIQNQQELLSKSKSECHHINELYSTRQAALREENETLKTEHADLTARLQDQEDLLQQIIKEKVVLEMELKDVLNKSNQTPLHLNRSIDVSYTDDHMLTALDSLNADSQFAQENGLLDEEAFTSALKEDMGRSTNLSLFDEIRLSFTNMSRFSLDNSTSARGGSDETHCEKFNNLDNSFIHIATQTEDFDQENYFETVGIQTDTLTVDFNSNYEKNTENIPSFAFINRAVQTNPTTELVAIAVQTDSEINNNSDYKCPECEKLSRYAVTLESQLNHSNDNMKALQDDLEKYESNLTFLQNLIDEGNDRNDYLQTVVDGLKSKISILEAACSDQRSRLDSITSETSCVECQTISDQTSVSTQVEVPCIECERRKADTPPQKGFRRYLWESIKSLFQLFAVVSFLCAVSVLYGVSRRWNARCERDPPAVPWRWLDAQDLMDFLLRIEYVADVPM